MNRIAAAFLLGLLLAIGWCAYHSSQAKSIEPCLTCHESVNP